MKKVFFSALAAFVVLGAAFLSGEREAEAPQSVGEAVGTMGSGYQYEKATVVIGDSAFSALVADTPEKRAQGLSGRDPLASDEAMLFIFETPEIAGFWMKDMRFSIDIAWLDDSGRVIMVAPDVSPETYPEVFYPSRPARYVVELGAGTMERIGAKAGDRASIER